MLDIRAQVEAEMARLQRILDLLNEDTSTVRRGEPKGKRKLLARLRF